MKIDFIADERFIIKDKNAVVYTGVTKTEIRTGQEIIILFKGKKIPCKVKGFEIYPVGGLKGERKTTIEEETGLLVEEIQPLDTN